ncbi:MAG TPA: bifunctional YncE family protein/alkaline phosphatase family protein [Candidatus Baltobacteraceae bacterium]|nr:bifunctional YncE family protein/alkaline phosphatase family protein [Candidatus Baltobacteraceae bacterium]
MTLVRFFAAFAALALAGAAPLPTVYTVPAGTRPAGPPNPANPYSTVLPNGRIVSPVGASVVVGMNALGLTLSPSGRYAIVSNDDEREAQAISRINPAARGGFSLAVVDTQTMRVTDVYQDDNLSLFIGVVAVNDPSHPGSTLVAASTGGGNTVRFWQLDGGGKLHAETTFTALPGPVDMRYANQNHAFPGWIALSPNHRVAYVVNNLADSVTALDLAKRRIMHTTPVGYFPYAAAVAGRRLYVTDPGLMLYGNLPQPVRYPPFSNVPFAPAAASAMTTIALTPGADVSGAVVTTPMDQAPDGSSNIGGAHPSAIAVSKNGRYAYVCMTNVDRIAIVSLAGVPRVIGGLQLRLYDRSPYGTQPDAIVRSPDGKRLYVALAGMNAVAVLDARSPAHLHRLGLIPTGWYPSGLAVSPSGRYLYVTNAKGISEEPRFEGGPPYRMSPTGHIYQADQDSNVIWATLQRIDLHKLPLQRTTFSALRYLRIAQSAKPNPIVPPLRSLQRSSVIRHVVFILEENKTYDAMLGDLTDAQGRPYGNGEASLVSFGQTITPNLHALAREFGLATNLYADAEESDAGHQFAAAGIATAYSEKTLLVKSGRSPLVNKNEDPEDYPRAGYIFNSAGAAGLNYRDYGDLVRLSGYDEGHAENPRDDDPNFISEADGTAPTSGLGGLYSLNVPALAALGNHIDLNYPGWNLRIRDVRRAREFIRDYTALEARNALPDFTYIWLPADHGGYGINIPPLPEEVADGDRALGMIVDFLSHRPSWNSTAIFITPDDAQSSRDHVSEHRTYAVVVSPYAKRHYTSAEHLSTVSILKTEEELLGLPPLSIGDLLAGDMSSFFSAQALTSPYTVIPVPTQTASVEGRRIAALLAGTDQSGPDADVERSARLIDLSRRADALAGARSHYSPQVYAARQKALYQAALHAFHLNDSE